MAMGVEAIFGFIIAIFAVSIINFINLRKVSKKLGELDKKLDNK
jgi:hypothetical protein